jgi:hypothetical protein
MYQSRARHFECFVQILSGATWLRGKSLINARIYDTIIADDMGENHGCHASQIQTAKITEAAKGVEEL